MKAIPALVVFLFLSSITVKAQDFCRTYNFDFEKNINADEDGWQGEFDSFVLRYDTVDKAQGKRSIVFSRTYLKVEFNSCLYRKILLPYPVKEIKASVFAKSSLLKHGWFKISGFDKLGKIVVSDSLSILNEDGWKKFTAKIKFPDIYLLSIEFRAREDFQEKKKEVKLWIDDISIVCDGTNLQSINPEVNSNQAEEILEANKNILLKDDYLLPDHIINGLANKKVIGFGETAHGSLETDKFIYANTRKLISDHNCRLIFFEMNIDKVAKYNLYINGYDVDTIHTPLNFHSREFGQFLQWLREYNANQIEKVNIFGIDLHSNPLSFNKEAPVLNSYLSSFKLSSTYLDSLTSLINSYKHKIIPLEYLVENKEDLSHLLGDLNYFVMKQILLNRMDNVLVHPKYNKHINFSWQQVHRDYLLWQNMKAFMEEFAKDGSPVVVCAHYAHLDKVSSIHFNEVITLGQHLTNAFGDDFYHIGVVLGEGEAGVMGKQGPIQYNLQPPVIGSLEYLAMKTDEDYFFKEGHIDSKIPLTIRRLGNRTSLFQFIPAYFPESMDGFVFIRKSKPSF